MDREIESLDNNNNYKAYKDTMVFLINEEIHRNKKHAGDDGFIDSDKLIELLESVLDKIECENDELKEDRKEKHVQALLDFILDVCDIFEKILYKKTNRDSNLDELFKALKDCYFNVKYNKPYPWTI